jgi:hypothetical protein
MESSGMESLGMESLGMESLGMKSWVWTTDLALCSGYIALTLL